MAAAHNRKKTVVPVPSKTANKSVGTPVHSDDTVVATAPGAVATENTVSMIFGAVVVGIILLLGVSFWRDWRRNQAAAPTPTPEATARPLVEVQELPAVGTVQTEDNEEGQPVPVNLPAKYVVKSGDSSWRIAQAFYGSGFNYVDIEQANNLAADSDLTMGQELTIPRVPVRTTAGAQTPGDYTMESGDSSMDTTPTGPEKGDTTAEDKMMQQ